MNHHITKRAKEVLWDFLTEIAPLTVYMSLKKEGGQGGCLVEEPTLQNTLMYKKIYILLQNSNSVPICPFI